MKRGRPAHLVRRGAMYHVRFRVPSLLVAKLEMVEFTRALSTSDPLVAKARCLRATLWYRTTMEAMSQSNAPSRAELERAAAIYFRKLAAEIDQPRHLDADHFDDAIAMNVELSRERIGQIDDQLRANIYDARTGLALGEMLDGVNCRLSDVFVGDQLAAHQLAARAMREQMQLLVHMLTTPAAPFVPSANLFTPTPLGLSKTTLAGLAEVSQVMLGAAEDLAITLEKAVTSYRAKNTARGLSQSELDESGRVLEWLMQRHGRDRALAAISIAELRTFRNDLERLDVTLRGRGAAFEARLTNVRANQIKSVTSMKYWRTVKAFFGWCKAEQYIDKDCSEGLRIEPRKGEDRKSPPPFTTAELERLFKTPLYAGYKSRSRINTPGSAHFRGGHWWSGLVLMFTGMRAGELAQLLPEDFIFDADVPHIKVRAEDDQGRVVKKTKNQASVRDIPASPVLLALGLREFIEQRRKAAIKGRVFVEFRLGTRGRTADGMTKFWSAFLKQNDLWVEGRATHVWRHTLIAFLRESGASEEDIAAVVGHSRNTATSGYGGSYGLPRKLETVERLNFGFDVVAALGGPYDKKRH